MNDEQERRYLDPLEFFYEDEDGDIHIDCSHIARELECSLEDAIRMAEDMTKQSGQQWQRLYAPKKKRGN